MYLKKYVCAYVFNYERDKSCQNKIHATIILLLLVVAPQRENNYSLFSKLPYDYFCFILCKIYNWFSPFWCKTLSISRNYWYLILQNDELLNKLLDTNGLCSSVNLTCRLKIWAVVSLVKCITYWKYHICLRNKMSILLPLFNKCCPTIIIIFSQINS